LDIPAPAYATIGAISAATIAGGISFLMVVLSKDQKTSEFRQAWIDGLRSETAKLISHFLVITDIVREMRRHEKDAQEIMAYLFEKDEHFCKLEMANAKIKLRLNPTEHQELLSAIAALRKYTASKEIMDSEAADFLVEKIIQESQTVLKNEWKRVKRGEPVFIATKWISLITMLMSIILGAAYANGHLYIKWLP